MLVRTRVTALGRGSGVPMESDGAGIWRIAGGRLAHFTLTDHVDREDALAALRAQAAG